MFWHVSAGRAALAAPGCRPRSGQSDVFRLVGCGWLYATWSVFFFVEYACGAGSEGGTAGVFYEKEY